MADNQSDGPSTDRHNDPVTDPSRNVRNEVEAATARQDDLREKDAKHLRELMAQSAIHAEDRLAWTKAIRKAISKAVQEKFRSVDVQLALIERMRVEQKADTQKAVDAALAAQKEAVREQTTASDREIRKSETAMTKQIDQQGVTSATAIAGVDRSVGDLKDRMDRGLGDLKDRVSRIENVKQGGNEARDDTATQRAEMRATRAEFRASAAVVVAILSMLVGALIALLR